MEREGLFPAKWTAEAINTITGGNKYVPGILSPTANQIDYLGSGDRWSRTRGKQAERSA